MMNKHALAADAFFEEGIYGLKRINPAPMNTGTQHGA